MTIFRSNLSIMTICVVALLSGCGDSTIARPDREPRSDTLAAILDSDLDNPELSAAINDKIQSLKGDGTPLADHLVAAGFRPGKTKPGCDVFTYNGPRKDRFGWDDTMRVTWTECSGTKETESELVVNFGGE